MGVTTKGVAFQRRSEAKIMKIEKAHFLCCLRSDKMNRPTLVFKFEASFAQQPFMSLTEILYEELVT